MPPHSGQGVSECFLSAYQFVQELSPYLKDESVSTNLLDTVFSTYQSKRKPRVEKIVAVANRQGNDKMNRSYFSDLLRKWIMRFFFQFIWNDAWMYETYDPKL